MPTAPPLSTELTLRPAIPTDSLCLSVLAMQVYLDTYAARGIRPNIARDVLSKYSESVFLSALKDAQTRICVAESEGHLIGFAQITLGARHEQAPAGIQAELLRLYVQEPFTGKRVGTRLLDEAEQLANQCGATVVWLTPWIHNHRAIGFYLARGYQDFGLTHYIVEDELHENRVHAKFMMDKGAV